MTQQQKDKLNKELCRLLGICWHETGGVGVEENGRIYSQCRICKKIFRDREWGYNELGYESSNPDFTSEAGRIKLLGIMRDRADWFRFLWRIMPDVPARDESGTRMLDNYVLNKTGRLAIAARDFLKAMEAKE